MSCPYNVSYNFRPKAQEYQFNSCVSDKLEKMNNEDSCMSYMSNILNNETTSRCSINDIKNICKNTVKDFTIQDARDLCKAEMEGANKFWSNKYPGAISP
jgi:hypothetical protein